MEFHYYSYHQYLIINHRPAYLEIPLVLASVIVEGAEGNSVALAVPGVLELLVDEDSTEDPYEYFVMLEKERHRGEKWRS